MFANDNVIDRVELCRVLVHLYNAMPSNRREKFGVALGDLASVAMAPAERDDNLGSVMYHEFANVLRTWTSIGLHQRMHGDDANGAASDNPTVDLMEHNIKLHVPRRLWPVLEQMRTRMQTSGYTINEIHDMLEAAFVSRDPEELHAVWRIFDPFGRGRLTLREFKIAFALFSDAVHETTIRSEFERIDCIKKGYIELKDFGPLLLRLLQVAHGSRLADDLSREISGAVRLEYRLFRLLDQSTIRAMPFKYHAFARRLLGTMQQHGFAPDQAAVVLRAIFSPDPEYALEATRQSWLLLGGTDWARFHFPSPDEVGYHACPSKIMQST